MILRAVEDGDSEQIVAWRNDPRIRGYFFEKFHFSLEAHRKWLQSYLTRLDREVYFVIEVDEVSVGTISIVNIADARGEVVRFLVDPQQQGKGYGRQALRLLVEYADERDIDLLYANIYEGNVTSRSTFASVGFQHLKTDEGICYYERPSA